MKLTCISKHGWNDVQPRAPICADSHPEKNGCKAGIEVTFWRASEARADWYCVRTDRELAIETGWHQKLLDDGEWKERCRTWDMQGTGIRARMADCETENHEEWNRDFKKSCLGQQSFQVPPSSWSITALAYLAWETLHGVSIPATTVRSAQTPGAHQKSWHRKFLELTLFLQNNLGFRDWAWLESLRENLL